ncbi:polysialic acid transporter [Corticibacter populi]|uniref:Polysialic acid transporter n=2 Tax=Corticibacter populi TaxID=1550736 RepID=A0A3M6QJ75_9BURK|nr:polysialic acid transporter [Corticibacter populi]RZS33036.1 protein involved in polysaccharide export with SLBB domain [Corticibacter populi]
MSGWPAVQAQSDIFPGGLPATDGNTSYSSQRTTSSDTGPSSAASQGANNGSGSSFSPVVPQGSRTTYTQPQGGGAPAPQVQPSAPQYFDYQSNLGSDVFGAQLFTGAFANAGAAQFNPDYVISSGDSIQVRLWGAFDYDAQLTVDPQGNIFLPHVGPVRVLGERNQNLESVVNNAVRRVFRANVQSYASLAAAQPVRIFVSGFVHRPGAYNGTSMDSLLHYLDQAGGVDPERGTFLAVQVKRGEQVRATVNLYDFLLSGFMPTVQLANGDVIFVPPRQNVVRVSGLVENAKRFEVSSASPTVAQLIAVAKPFAEATHVRVQRNTGDLRNTEYYPLSQASQVFLQNGDELEFTADKKPGTITVRVEGEHMSPQEYVLPYGSKLGELIGHIHFNDRSELESIQLFRRSVQDRQKQILETSLRSLETSVLTARSGSTDEARLRQEEANLTLQWIDRARKVQPLGQVVIAPIQERATLLLENGDVLRIPTRDGLVLVGGEVLFPNAVAYDSRIDLADYINRAGGYTQQADDARVVVARRDGTFEQVNMDRWGTKPVIKAGDQILVLPKVDEKNRQFWKDITQIMYQIAVSAKVVFGL